MVENRTFKDSEGVLVYQNDYAPENNEYWAFAGELFNSNEWDMEVTFTRKVRKPKVGDKALSPSGISTCEIAAIDGDEVWLRYSDGSHSTIDKDKLIYAS